MKLFHLIFAAILGACLALPVVSQERAPATVVVAQKEKSPKATVKTTPKKPSTRLPNNFGKLELTDIQTARIKEVLGGYNAQIDQLEERIAALKERRDAEVQAMLTFPQKAKLAELEGETKTKKAEKAKAGKSSEDE